MSSADDIDMRNDKTRATVTRPIDITDTFSKNHVLI